MLKLQLWHNHAYFFPLCFSLGDVSVCSRKHPKTLHHPDEEAKAAAISLQAFVCYHRLYKCWWRNSADNQDVQDRLSLSAADSCPADEAKDEAVNGGLSESGENVCPPTRRPDKLDFDVSLLLSEPHAACQAMQRSVREIQERLATMVLQHSRAQREQLDPGEKQEKSSTTKSPDRQGSTDAEQQWVLCYWWLTTLEVLHFHDV